MRLSISHFLFLPLFIFFIPPLFAQWDEPFSPNFPLENHSSEKNVETVKDPFSTSDHHSFSGDLLTNILSQNKLLGNDGPLLGGGGITPPEGPPISGIPVNSGLYFLLFLSFFYLLFMQSGKIKRYSFLLILFLIFTGNLQAQPPLKANTDNVFAQPWSSSSIAETIDILKNDELGGCGKNEITIDIQQIPKKGSYSFDSNQNIVYTPNANFVGQDSIKYTITCKGQISNEALVLINVFNKPENIIDACAIPPVKMEWGIKELARSDYVISISNVPLVGDFDNDGKTDFLCTNVYDRYESNKLLIFTYDESHVPNLYLKYQISTPIFRNPGNAYVVANVDNDGYSSIFFTTNGSSISTGTSNARQLIKYRYNGSTWYEEWRRTYSTTDTYQGCSPIVADFMGTGNSQVAVYDKIWDAKTGALLVNGNFLGSSGCNFGRFAHSGGTGVALFSSSWLAADIDNDGILEIIGGNSVYKVNIVDFSGMNNSLNSYGKKAGVTVDKQIGNGTTAIADIDGDGFLDIITTWNSVSIGSLAVYNPRTGQLMSQIITNLPIQTGTWGTGPSNAFIGDILGSGNPQIVFTGNLIMSAYAYDTTKAINNRLTPVWTIATSDPSAATAMSLFDFNQDGIAELIYRDETDLRIINGSGKSHITSNDTIGVYDITTIENVFSYTLGEYPIVVDVNNDGHAEIVTNGSASRYQWNASLQIYSSKFPNESPWAPARAVWDKYAYNPVYINDDLTVPQYPLNPATEFLDKDGIYHRPFNNFLQQSTLLNDEGRILNFGPDVAFDKSAPGTNSTGVIYTPIGEDLDVTIYIQNEGDAVLPSPLIISAYIVENGIFTKVHSEEIDIQVNHLAPKSSQLFFLIENIVSRLGGVDPSEAIQIRLNEVDNNFIHQECKYSNNYSNTLIYGAPDIIACENEPIRLNIYPQQANLFYVWRDKDNNAISGDYIDVIKDGSDVQTYSIDVYLNGTIFNPGNPYQVNLYRTPDSLIWIGTGNDSDWHNHLNWLDPNDPAPVYPQAKIPRSCTNVLIPDGMTYYPNLNTQSTSRIIYWDASCNNIHFEFGGEVARTDSLHYSKAFIQYNFGYYDSAGAIQTSGYLSNPSTMERNRWYSLAAPLKNIVTGDFSFGGKPHTWQQGFVSSQPQTGTWVGQWLRPDSTNNIALNQNLNYAITVWAGGSHAGATGHDYALGYQDGLNALKGVLELPYFETDADLGVGPHRIHEYNVADSSSYFSYYRYDVPTIPIEGYYPKDKFKRGWESYRFIFDGNIVQTSDGKNAFKMTVPAGKEIMVGNPFLSSLDFEAFYDANSSKIEPFYRLFENESWDDKYIYGINSELIASQQAFFIQTTGATGTLDLYFPFETTSVNRETSSLHQLRSAQDKTIEDVLFITATNKEKSNSIQLILSDEENKKNVHKLFYEYSEQTPQIYFLDNNNQKNAIQLVDNSTKREIPLGIQLKSVNHIELDFSNLENLSIESLFLLDKQTGTRQDLFTKSNYSFIHSNVDSFSDRFVLEVGEKDYTYMNHLEKNEISINVYQTNGSITISSTEKIDRIELFDLQGNMIEKKNNVNNNIYQMNPNLSTGIYLIKTVLTNGESQTDKIIIQ